MLRQTAKSNNKTVAKESVSLWTVFLMVLFLFIVICFALIYFRYSPNSPLYNLYIKVPSAVNLNDILSKETAQIKSGETIAIKITESQLEKSVCLKCGSFPLKKAQLEIKSDGINLKGKTSTGFWGISLEFLLQPKIINDSITFEVSEAKAAGVEAPPKLTEKLNPQIESLFENVMPDQNLIKPKEINSMEGYLLLRGIRK